MLIVNIQFILKKNTLKKDYALFILNGNSSPLHKTEFTETHKSIVFSAATFILFSTGLMTVLDNVAQDTKKAFYFTGNTVNTIGSRINNVVSS